MTSLSCGHPIDCWDDRDEDDLHCDWCEEVRILKESNTSLREQLSKQAVIVYDGHPVIRCNEIGFLEILGGSVSIEGLNPKLITNRTEKVEPDICACEAACKQKRIPCKGECGCQVCHDAYQDFLSEE